MPTPYRINVSDAVLDDLRQRLDRTRWAESLPGEPWERGADVAYVRELCDYWRTSYDWRAQEAAINAWPQFISTIDGVDIHYWHVRAQPNAGAAAASPLPLILVHGWPGSIVEFLDMIGPLTDPAAHGGNAADAFDVIIPELPGFGFSGKPREPGWGPARIADAFDVLMTKELGYARYGTQGGDWGSAVTSMMASFHGEHVIGAHLNFVVAGPPKPEDAQTPDGKAFLESAAHFQNFETAYQQVQSTKPQSLAMAHADSPAGLAAWTIEKFRTWSDCDGNVESVFTKDQLITNIMFYWANNSIASAHNIYYEFRHAPSRGFPPITVPVGVASFPKEMGRAPRSWVEARMNITHWTDMPRGGHFAAMEQPALLTEDVRAFFRPLRPV